MADEIRKVPMTDEQYTMLRSCFVTDKLAETLGKTFFAALQQAVKEQENAWDSIYAELGADRLNDTVVISWFSREFTIQPNSREKQMWQRIDARNDIIESLVEAASVVLARTLGNVTYGNPEQKETTDDNDT